MWNFSKKIGYKHLLSPAVLRFCFDSYKDKQCECFEVLPHSDWFRGERMIPGYIWIVLTELKKWYSYSPDIFKPNIIHISIWMNFQTIIYSFLYLHNLSNQNIIHIRLKFENWIAQISPKIKFCFVIKFSLYLESGSNDNCWCPQISKFFTKVKNQRFALFTFLVYFLSCYVYLYSFCY